MNAEDIKTEQPSTITNERIQSHGRCLGICKTEDPGYKDDEKIFQGDKEIFHWNKILQYKELNIDYNFNGYRNPENPAENQKNLLKRC